MGSIEVGPSMLKNNLDFTYAIVWLLAPANVVGTIIYIAASGGITKLTEIRFALLAPFLFMIIAMAAFQSRQEIWDLVALFGIGLLGILMRRFDWSRPAFLIGFVLSAPAEQYTNQAYQSGIDPRGGLANGRRAHAAGADDQAIGVRPYCKRGRGVCQGLRDARAMVGI